MDWIRDELRTLDLGDARLERRAALLLGRLFDDPQASVNAACHGWAETQAAYRFFDNPKVTPEAVLAPHTDATLARARLHPVVLAVQDSTELDLSAHPPDGAGPLHSLAQLGFLDHTHLALTPEGLCLGVLGADLWARSPDGFGQAKRRQHDPIESKETFRWLLGYRLACRVAQEVGPGTLVVSVADCEGDLYEVFAEADGLARRAPARAEYVVRMGKDRAVTEPDPQAGPDAYRKARQEVAAAPLVATRRLQLRRTPKRQPRTADLEVRACAVELKAPYRKAGPRLPDLTVNVVWVREVGAVPEGEEPVEWLLLTSLPVGTAEEALRVVDHYVGRWPVEVFFRVYKSGCRVEQVRLETAGRLLPCLMLYKVVAWRVLYLTALGREVPQMPCDVAFAEQEWKPVWQVATGQAPPEAAPPLGEVVALLGRLGGHNGRKGDGPPGAEAVWRGVRRMADLALAWRTFGPGSHHTQPPAPKGNPPNKRTKPKTCV